MSRGEAVPAAITAPGCAQRTRTQRYLPLPLAAFGRHGYGGSFAKNARN